MAEIKSNLSILVIDDEPFVLGMVIRILNKLGYINVDTANNGSVALGKLITVDTPYELIICDLNMPEMDGVAFMGHAHESGFTGGMILLSGEDTRMLETALGLAKVHELNVLGALKKPLQLKEIEELLDGFEPNLSEEHHLVPEKSISEQDLLDGIKLSTNNKLHLVYQPKVSVQTGEIVGVETLARWWNRDRGVLGPAAFIPIAESSGHIDSLTNLIYIGALEQAAEWADQGRKLRTAVNFSVHSFSNSEFCQFILSAEAKYGLGPDNFVLEITETQAMSLPTDCLEALMTLRLKKFGLSIDDFGTGNSSLVQLKNIPFTEMKIDRAFVHGAAKDHSALAILETSISLAKKLGMEIVAEGAETREDWDLAEKLGCDYVQGFYCAKPMRNEDLVDFMDNWDGPHS